MNPTTSHTHTGVCSQLSEVVPYQVNLIAAQRWAKMDRTEPVVARMNGLPITTADLVAEMPCDVDPFDAAFALAPFWPDKDPA